MKIVSFQAGGSLRFGVVVGRDEIVDITEKFGPEIKSLNDFIAKVDRSQAGIVVGTSKPNYQFADLSLGLQLDVCDSGSIGVMPRMSKMRPFCGRVGRIDTSALTRSLTFFAWNDQKRR